MASAQPRPSAPLAVRSAPVRTLLAHDRRPAVGDRLTGPWIDRIVRGAVARRPSAARLVRAEPGPCGPLVLSTTVHAGTRVDEVWGAAATPADAAGEALQALRAWTGDDDRPEDLREVVADHPLLRQLERLLGPVRMGRLPRVTEAVGRAVIHQLVQSGEAVRSVAQLVAAHGEPTPEGVTAWPTPSALGAVPAWTLRRCGVSLRGARALHAACVDDAALRRAADAGFGQLDRRLRALPGVGAWTSAETRLALGDPDAVSVGDYHLHAWVTWALRRVDPRDSDDAQMLALLEPFSGQRGRVVMLIGRAYARGALPRPPRRAPHAAQSAHRYW